MRTAFDTFKDLLEGYGNGEHSYKSFAARVKRRVQGKPEELTPPEPSEVPEAPPGWYDELE